MSVIMYENDIFFDSMLFLCVKHKTKTFINTHKNLKGSWKVINDNCDCENCEFTKMGLYERCEIPKKSNFELTFEDIPIFKIVKNELNEFIGILNFNNYDINSNIKNMYENLYKSYLKSNKDFDLVYQYQDNIFEDIEDMINEDFNIHFSRIEIYRELGAIECCVCLDDCVNVVVLKSCSHKLCSICYKTIKSEKGFNAKCPLCRANM